MLKLVEKADGLIEGFRPASLNGSESAPTHCLKRNSRLVYGRMTGWGQEGPMALAAGHDINYIALSGALHSIGRNGEAPVPPLNLVGDFGGGALYLALGMVAGILETQKSGKGQVVDAAMVDGAASLMTAIYGMPWSGAGTTIAATTSSTPARITTKCMKPKTESTSRSDRSKPSSTKSCCNFRD